MIIKPFEKFHQSNITSRFNANEPWRGAIHTGTDFVSPEGYGTPLLAPTDCSITKIITPGRILNEAEGLEHLKRGYGVEMEGGDGTFYLYWHCLPIFPVREGEIAKRGKIVAFMGNSGLVYRFGKLVPLEVRSIFPYLGAHLHAEKYRWENGQKKYYDFALDIDWNIPISLKPIDKIFAFRVAISKITALFKDYVRN